MGNNVYANGNAVACEAGDDKVIAAFPDVCLSPPSPPAGPIPVPYPDSSFSRDMKEGSKSVKIDGKPVMLKDQSYYKSSPLGDEAATNSFGANVMTHVITGKTYFNAWSMDVKIEGANADRHLDLATSNHASYPAGSGPMTAMEKMAVDRVGKGKCPCCGKAPHTWQGKSTGTVGPPAGHDWFKTDSPMHLDEWYKANIAAKFPRPSTQTSKLADFNTLMAKAKARPGCVCKSKTRLLPEAPCDVFFGPPVNTVRSGAVKSAWDEYRKTSNYQRNQGIGTIPHVTAKLTVKLGRAPRQEEVDNERKVNHLTPKSAGGCPTGGKNLQPNRKLCGPCQAIDDEFSKFQ